MAEPLLKWHAPEFEHRPKGPYWHWASIGIAILLLTLAIIQGNFLFAVFIIIAEIMVLIWSQREPKIIPFEIHEHELLIDGQHRFILRDLEAFGFIELDPDREHAELGLIFKQYRPMVHVLMPKNLVKPVEQKLKLHGRKKDLELPVVDLLEHMIGF